MINYGTRLLVNRSNYRDVKVLEDSAPDVDSIQPGQVVLRLEKFAYTSNNTTYAVVGDIVGYWKFFPVSEEGHGIIPCWGFGEVITSKNEQIATGTRYYGYFPMGSHLIVQPDKISERGFTDIVSHRAALPVIYNQYTDCGHDPLYKKELEDFQAIFRPLFTTSFLIHDQFSQNGFYNSKQIILTSASSKTALGLAHCLKSEDITVIGLTSTHNVEMVKLTGYYDQVYAYGALDQIAAQPSSYVDFSGNHDLQLKLQKHLGAHLNEVCLVGVVHWEEREGQEPLPKKGSFFFAPTYAAQRIKEMGHAAFGMALAKKYGSFISEASRWVKIKEHVGGAALATLHGLMTDGKIDAKEGHIVRL